MVNKVWINFSIACFALGVTTAAQEVRPGPLAALPGERGVYYRGTSGWVPLPSNLVVPFWDGGAKEFFGVGRREAIAELPGAHAVIRITNSRPTFYVQGLPAGSRLYLVRGREKDDYRQLRMPLTQHFPNAPRFHSKDLQEVEVAPVSGNVIRITPHGDLKPGEYVILSVLESAYRWIRLGFGFGVTTGTT